MAVNYLVVRRWPSAVSLRSLFTLMNVILSLLSTQIHAEEDITIPRYESGYSGRYGFIRSPSFLSPYSLDGQVYTYHLRCYEAYCYVRVVFTDFDLHNGSLLKIYDGEDISGLSSIWTQQDRPIYQSSSGHLLIVFKPGRPEGINKRQRTDSWTPTDYPISNLGFKFNYSFVSENRETWQGSEKGLPAKGCCYHSSYTDHAYGGAVVKHPHSSLLCDCVFSVDFFFVGVLTLTLPNTSWIADGLVTVEGSSTSDKYYDLVIPPPIEKQKYFGQDILIFSGRARYYIRVSSQLGSEDQIKFGFHRGSVEAIELLKEYPSPSPCPYKTCQWEHGHRCVLYWEACLQDSEASCDRHEEFTDRTCDHKNRCYNRTLEYCDGYKDCEDSSDEKDCDVEKYNWKSVLVGLAILLVIALLWYAVKNNWFKQLKRIPDCCINTVRKCLGRCCSGGTCGCSLRCSHVCMCCVVPPIRDDQPASATPASFTPSATTEVEMDLLDLPENRSTTNTTSSRTAGRGRGRGQGSSNPPSTPGRGRGSVDLVEVLNALDQERRSPAPSADAPPSYGDATRMPPGSQSAPDMSDLFNTTSEDSIFLRVQRGSPSHASLPPPSYDEAVDRCSSVPPPSEEPPPYDSVV